MLNNCKLTVVHHTRQKLVVFMVREIMESNQHLITNLNRWMNEWIMCILINFPCSMFMLAIWVFFAACYSYGIIDFFYQFLFFFFSAIDSLKMRKTTFANWNKLGARCRVRFILSSLMRHYICNRWAPFAHFRMGDMLMLGYVIMCEFAVK